MSETNGCIAVVMTKRSVSVPGKLVCLSEFTRHEDGRQNAQGRSHGDMEPIRQISGINHREISYIYYKKGFSLKYATIRDYSSGASGFTFANPAL
jgi:hypothetical protein